MKITRKQIRKIIKEAYGGNLSKLIIGELTQLGPMDTLELADSFVYDGYSQPDVFNELDKLQDMSRIHMDDSGMVFLWPEHQLEAEEYGDY